jgi:hypothetical protein
MHRARHSPIPERILGAASWLASLLAAALSLGERTGSAQPSPEPVVLVYRGAPNCPPAQAFREEFHGRTARARFVEAPAAAARRFTVTLSAADPGFFGRIDIRQLDGSTATRELTGQTCREVVSALSLVGALVVDPKASAAPRSELVVPPDRAEVSGNAAPPQEPQRWPVALGFDVGAFGGVLPGTSAFGAAFIDLAIEREAALAPSFRLAIEGAPSHTLQAGSGSADFHWFAAALEVCPFRFRLAGGLLGYPCAIGEGGVLVGEGGGVPASRTSRRRWVSLGAGASLRWMLGDRFFVEAHGAVHLPLARDTFVFEGPGRIVIYEVPAAGARAALGAAFLFR